MFLPITLRRRSLPYRRYDLSDYDLSDCVRPGDLKVETVMYRVLQRLSRLRFHRHEISLTRDLSNMQSERERVRN